MKGELLTRSVVKMGIFILTLVVLKLNFLCFSEQSAYASHFRYGHVSWKPGAGTNEIEFTLDGAFRRDGYLGSAGDGRPAVGDIITETVGATGLNFGDGMSTGTLQFKVTSIDPANNWLFARALQPGSSSKTTISHTYAAAGNYTAFVGSCCRISRFSGVNEHINNPDRSYRVETVVHVGTGNSSPVSALPPIVLCPQNGLCTFIVPGADTDGDTLNFRLSTSSEAGSGFIQPASTSDSASISSTGTYSWDTTGATLALAGHNTLYSTQVTIEELDDLGNVKGKSAVDFLIQLVPMVGAVPEFDHPPTPACGTTLTGNIGSTMTFTVQASDTDTGDTVELNVGGLPPSATMTPSLPTSGNPVASVFSWTPTAGEAGVYVMTFSATDNSGQQSLCSITAQVFLEECTNGIDDDGDGLVDCDDPDCTDDPGCKTTAISLISFTGGANDKGGVTLTWETATEVNNAGFNLYRARLNNGSYIKINDTLIPAQGNAVSGASYSYEDTPGKGTFYYKLEDVDETGVSTMHGPEKVRVRSDDVRIKKLKRQIRK